MSSYSPLVVVFSRIPALSSAIKKLLGQINVRTVAIPQEGCELDTDSLSTLKEAEILLADPGPIASCNLSQDLSNLKWLQSTWAGIDAMIKALDTNKPLPDYQFTRVSGYFGQTLGEYVIGHIISTERKFSDMKDDQRHKLWRSELYNAYRPLQDLTLGILGMGDIGREIARMAKSLGMTVEGLVRKVPVAEKSSSSVDKYRTLDDLPGLLECCDYICNVLPSTQQTRGLLNGDILSHCHKKKPVFMNLGRGDLIDESVILKSLEDELLSHVVLDVFQQEPLPADSALWLHPKVTITPHVSGVSFPHQVAELFVKNYEKYIKQETLLYPVNWENGY